MKKYCSFILLSFLVILFFIYPTETFAESSTIQYNHIPIEGIIGKENDQNFKVVEKDQGNKMKKLPKLGSGGEASRLLSLIGVILIIIVVELKFICGGVYEEN
ncbi:hypothetical protein [Enterococcus songbeiensis]|uniref:hypothetical protein n=1 Tax=Enterococcus songbeiensis TaxID=2559927 RepID=UPI0010F960D2|nr:hypothetical protein [Enterococcus songbeiensis]